MEPRGIAKLAAESEPRRLAACKTTSAKKTRKPKRVVAQNRDA
jgi:hypothetical protein